MPDWKGGECEEGPGNSQESFEEARGGHGDLSEAADITGADGS